MATSCFNPREAGNRPGTREKIRVVLNEDTIRIKKKTSLVGPLLNIYVLH